ncbi:MAG: ABC transporter ATP-binding protein [Litorimonas sp.]
MAPSIKLENVGVHFNLPQVRSQGMMNSFKTVALGGIITQQKKKVGVNALDNVSIHLKQGDRVALIGHNGAGKTTLLRVLAGIMPPTSGKIRVEGRISSLISIQLGLNNHSTGRENIRLRARYMGFTEKEIDSQFTDIIEFSNLNDFIDLPLRSYSSGMRLRLAFAIATAFRPDILILDEWLSAGDENFQKKAGERLGSLIDRTGIFIFASHNSKVQSRTCNKGIVLRRGKILFRGDIDDAIKFNRTAEY